MQKKHLLFLLIYLILHQVIGSNTNERHLMGKDDIIEVSNEDELFKALDEVKEDVSTVIELKNNINLSKALVIGNEGLTIKGKSSSDKIKIKCKSEEAAIEITSNDVTLENLIITECVSPAVRLMPIIEENDALMTSFLKNIDFMYNGGFTNEYKVLEGGAIHVNYKATAIIEDCLFEGNEAGSGASIFVNGGYLTLDNSIFRNNIALISGGAITARAYYEDYDNSEALIKITNSQFINNSDTSGGVDTMGLMMDNGAPLETSEFLSFSAPQVSAGAIYVSDYGTVEIKSCIFERNTAVPAAGALYIADNKEVTIDDCIFTENEAKSDSSEKKNYDIELGGAVYVAFVEPESKLYLDNCIFERNKATYGGGLHIVTPVTNEITLENVTFTQNTALLGGGGFTVRSTLQVKIRNVKFYENSATAGGGLLFTNGAGAQFAEGVDANRDVVFQDNMALDGGGAFFFGAGQVSTKRLHFYNNKAERNGGGVCMIESLAKGAIDFDLGEFIGNKAERGGAIFMDSVAKLYVKGRPKESLIFTENKAMAGGAIYARTSSQVRNNMEIGYCNFNKNKVFKNSNELFDHDEINIPSVTSLSIINRKLFNDDQSKEEEEEEEEKTILNTRNEDPCFSGGGGGICIILSEIPERASVLFKVSESEFTENSAATGGGMFISTKSSDNWHDSCELTSTSESLVRIPCRGISIQKVKLESNFANGAGGAIFTTSAENIHISSEVNLYNEKKFQKLSNYVDKSLVKNNLIGKGGYGDDFASNAVCIKSKLDTTNINGVNISIVDHASGEPLPEIQLEVHDAFGNVVSNGIHDSELKVTVHSDDGVVAGQLVSKAERGLVTFDTLTVTGIPKVYELEFDVEISDIQKERQFISIRECNIGEYNITQKKICTRCEKDTFSFDPIVTCQSCPDNANCTGGPAMIPQDGYWHSTPYSPQIHECLYIDACSYPNRSDALLEFYSKEENLNPNSDSVSNKLYPQCNSGYTDVLCGSCEEGYGHMPGGECKKCHNYKLSYSIVGLVALWTLGLLGFTIRSALASIRDMRDMQEILKHNELIPENGTAEQKEHVLTSFSRKYSSEIPTLTQVLSFGRSSRQKESVTRHASIDDRFSGESFRSQVSGNSHTTMSLEKVSVKQKMQNHEMSSDSEDGSVESSIAHIMAAEQVSETIKIAVNYLQVTSIAVGINVEWTKTVMNMLKAQNTLAGFSKGSSYSPLTCLVSNAINRAVQGIVVRIAFTLGLSLVVILFFFLNWFRLKISENKPISYFKSRTVICILVVLFFSYECITEELMRIFSCIKLDDETYDTANTNDLKNTYYEYSTASELYWVEDSSLLCYHGHHTILVYILGIPGLLFFSAGIPVFLFIFLLYKREKDKLLDQDFLNTYGFVYQNYKARFVYWEVCIMIRKACIGGIVVFAYRLGANLQGIMALGALIIALILHLVATPFKYVELNVLESFSLVVSIVTFYSGVVFNDENTSHSAKVFLSLVLLLISLSLMLMFAWRVYVGCDSYVTAKLNLFKVKNVPKNFPARAIKLGTVMVAKATVQVHQTITGSRFGRSLTIKKMDGKMHQKSTLEEISETPIEGTCSGIIHSQTINSTSVVENENVTTTDNQENVVTGVKHENVITDNQENV